MRGRLAVAAMILCAGLAAGCSKPRPSAGAPVAARAPSGEVMISQAQLPHPRAGEWAMTVSADGQVDTTRRCVADRALNLGRPRGRCRSFVFHRSAAGGYSVDSDCGAGGVASTLRMTAAGDFQSAYSTDVQVSFTLGPGDKPHLSQTHTDYRYLGPCAAGEAADAAASAKGR